jgi:hypothetical protein
MNKNPVSASKMVVLDVGRQKRKAINDLKQGIGPLFEEVEEAQAAAAEQQGKGDKEVLPVVIVYRKAGQKRRGLVRDILSRL